MACTPFLVVACRLPSLDAVDSTTGSIFLLGFDGLLRAVQSDVGFKHRFCGFSLVLELKVSFDRFTLAVLRVL